MTGYHLVTYVDQLAAVRMGLILISTQHDLGIPRVSAQNWMMMFLFFRNPLYFMVKNNGFLYVDYP